MIKSVAIGRVVVLVLGLIDQQSFNGVYTDAVARMLVEIWHAISG
jgi:hypothetical protein